jgi:hypothetical protein
MKKIAFIILLNFASVSLWAQSVVVSFLEKYGKDESIRITSIGKKMFEKIEEQSLATPELLKAIKGLDNIRIITSEDQALSDEYYSSAYSILSKDKDFVELFVIENEDLQMTVKMKECKGIVNELIILSDNSEGFNLINITGNIDLGILAGYSSSINFKELEQLDSMEN